MTRIALLSNGSKAQRRTAGTKQLRGQLRDVTGNYVPTILSQNFLHQEDFESFVWSSVASPVGSGFGVNKEDVLFFGQAPGRAGLGANGRQEPGSY